MATRVAVFLDRDGTLTQPRDFPSRPSDLVLYEDIVPPLRALKDRGVLLIMVTNQSGLAHGYFNVDDFRLMRAALDRQLRRRGVVFDAVYYCPHHPLGTVPVFSVRCRCRKPEPGMLLRAAHEHAIDLTRSWMIGDFISDVEAGRRAGCRTAWVCRDPAARPSQLADRVVTATADALWYALAGPPSRPDAVPARRCEHHGGDGC